MFDLDTKLDTILNNVLLIVSHAGKRFYSALPTNNFRFAVLRN